jgi:hypothetical protein
MSFRVNQNKTGLSDLLMASVPAPMAMVKQSHHHIIVILLRQHVSADARARWRSRREICIRQLAKTLSPAGYLRFIM